MNRKLVVGGVAALLLAILAASSLFVVSERDQAIVLQLGEYRTTHRAPGLKVKIPFVQNVIYYEKRVLDLDPPVQQVILADQKRLEVDAFARYRIADPLRFYQRVRNEANAETQLANTLQSSMRAVVGNVTLLDILSDKRAQIMTDIRSRLNEEAEDLGIEIVDVRIRRADLPEETSQAIYARMRSEREREAAEARAQGQEQAQQIRSRAERERTVILAEAQRDSQVLRGEGDNQALLILGEAAGRDAEFYRFYRTLQAYRESLRNEDTTLILSPEGEFFRYFGTLPSGGDASAVAGGPTGLPSVAPEGAAAPSSAPASTAAN